MTVKEYFTEWLTNKKPELEASTYDTYTICVNKHIIPYLEALGKTRENITPMDIKRYTTEKLTRGRVDDNGGLSRVSVRKHLSIIKQAFREAALYELIAKNPAEPIKMPRVRSVSERTEFITLTQAKRILTALKGHPLYELVYITLYYGLRRSEVLGLKWSAVDFGEDALHINHTVVKNLTIVAKDRTKTDSSRRTFPLFPEVKEMLLRMKEASNGRSEYIFTWEDGRLYRPDYVTRGFQRALRSKGEKVIRFHDLRHATASLLFDMGWSVPDVQHWLGHSDIETTMNIYVAYNQERKIAVGGALQGVFAGLG